MKHIRIKYSTTLSIVLLTTACSTSPQVSPSENDALNAISNSSAKSDKGSLQSALDSFLEDDWTPTVEKDKAIQKKYMKRVDTNESSTTNSSKFVEDEDKPFTLQEYVDKRAAYVKEHPADHNNSHVHKLEMMPVIGNNRKR